MLCIIPLQDLMAMFEQLRTSSYSGERINNPADQQHVWDYRIHIKLEELSSSGVFQETLRKMAASSGRGYRLSFSPSE
jgi:4-alpha-glucanotransferase